MAFINAPLQADAETLTVFMTSYGWLTSVMM